MHSIIHAMTFAKAMSVVLFKEHMSEYVKANAYKFIDNK